MESSVLGFCLVNAEARRCLTSVKPTPSEDYRTTSLTAGENLSLKWTQLMHIPIIRHEKKVGLCVVLMFYVTLYLTLGTNKYLSKIA